MKFYCCYLFAFAILFSASLDVRAQTLDAIESELIGYVEQMRKSSAYSGNFNEEALYAAGEKLQNSLLSYTKREDVLNHAFPRLSKLIYIRTSPDRNLRIYSWDTEAGGTMHFFSALFQYRDSAGKISSEMEGSEFEGDTGGFYSEIFQMPTRSGTVYLTVSNSIMSTMDSGQSLALYQIRKTGLTDKVNLIKTGSGLTNAIYFNYNFFSVVDRKERPIKLVHFDPKLKTFRIPVVIESKKFPNGEVTKRFITYKFNGTHFVRSR